LETAPLKIYAQQDKLTKTVHVQYLNQSNQPLLLWIGDWVINYYEPDTYRYSSYKTPFTNIIYIQKSLQRSQESFDYFYANNLREYTNFDNYRLLDVGESLNVKLGVAEQVFQEMLNKRHEVLIVYSVIDIVNLKSELGKTVASSKIQNQSAKQFFDPLLSFRKKGDKNFSFNDIQWALPQKIYKNAKGGTKNNHDSPLNIKPLAPLQIIKQYADGYDDSLSCELIHAFSRQYSVRTKLN
jgi:hypothetical protein